MHQLILQEHIRKEISRWLNFPIVEMKYAKWKINASGWTTMEYEYNMEGDQPFAGISFNYPENYV